jgi:hypothetical protein
MSDGNKGSEECKSQNARCGDRRCCVELLVEKSSDKIAVVTLRPSLTFVGSICLQFCSSLCRGPVLFWPACEQWTWTAALTKAWPVSCRMESFLRTTVFTAGGRAVPPALCATAASSQCWQTDLRSPIGPWGAQPAMRMACSLATFATNSCGFCLSAFIPLSLKWSLINDFPTPPLPFSARESLQLQITSTIAKLNYLMTFCEAGNISIWV